MNGTDVGSTTEDEYVPQERETMDATSLLTFILLCLGLVFLAHFISVRRIRSAVSRVIGIFQEHKAIGIHQAKTIDELGLRPPGFVERLGRLRDYKQTALKLLLKAEAIRMTEEGKLYIPEEKMDELVRKGLLGGKGLS